MRDLIAEEFGLHIPKIKLTFASTTSIGVKMIQTHHFDIIISEYNFNQSQLTGIDLYNYSIKDAKAENHFILFTTELTDRFKYIESHLFHSISKLSDGPLKLLHKVASLS